MDFIDFTALAEGASWDELTALPCPVCGKMSVPGRMRKWNTFIHSATIVRKALHVQVFCLEPVKFRVHYPPRRPNNGH